MSRGLGDVYKRQAKYCNVLDIYKRRWDIETAFKGCKTSGFKMENCKLRNPKRLITFMKCIFIAYAIALKIGEKENKITPIKTKSSLGCKVYSLLKYGLQIIKEAYINSSTKILRLILYDAIPNKQNKNFVR